MTKKTLLYLTASSMSAHNLARGRLVVDAQFECNDEGVSAFSAYVDGSRALF